MRLHCFPLSSNARRAVVTALHLEAPIELVNVDLAKGEQKSPEFLKLNPNGYVPVLEDAGLVLHESHAIMIYLCERTPKQTLYPTEPAPRADVNRWLFWNAQHLQPAVGTLNFERMVKRFRGLGDPDPREVERGERLFATHASVLDQHLAGRAWIAQGRLTIADFAIAATLMTEHTAKLAIDSFPNVRAWLERVRALPAWRSTEPPARG